MIAFAAFAAYARWIIARRVEASKRSWTVSQRLLVIVFIIIRRTSECRDGAMRQSAKAAVQ